MTRSKEIEKGSVIDSLFDTYSLGFNFLANKVSVSQILPKLRAPSIYLSSKPTLNNFLSDNIIFLHGIFFFFFEYLFISFFFKKKNQT